MRYLQQDKQPPILLQILHAKVDLRLADALNACSKVEAVERLRHESDVDDGDCDVVKSEMSFSNFGHSSTSTTMATTTVNHLLKKTEDAQKLQVRIPIQGKLRSIMPL